MNLAIRFIVPGLVPIPYPLLVLPILVLGFENLLDVLLFREQGTPLLAD